jgi:hypothetical protein
VRFWVWRGKAVRSKSSAIDWFGKGCQIRQEWSYITREVLRKTPGL